MNINNDDSTFIAQKDARFVNPIRSWHHRQKERTEAKIHAGQPLGIGLYLFQNFVLDRTEYFTLANLLSFVRGLLAYPYYLLFSDAHYLAALTVLLIGYATDFFDGIIAKGLYQETETGKIADPFFDKVLNGTVVLGLWQSGFVAGWVAIAIVGLDAVLIFMAFILKPIATALGLRRESGANAFGKWKFTCQCFGLGGLLLAAPLTPFTIPWYLCTALGYAGAILALPMAFCSIIEHAFPNSLVSPTVFCSRAWRYLR